MSTISINCAAFSDGRYRAFTVEIPSDKNVSILKELIKEKQPLVFSDTVSSDIQLFKVSLSEVELMAHRGAPVAVDPTQELSLAFAMVSDVFKDLPRDKVNVIALAPTAQQGGSPLKRRREEEEPTELRKRSKALQEARDAPKPSSVSKSASKLLEEQQQRPIYNGRPIALEGPPIVLYEPAFADIKDKLDGISSMPVDEELVTDVTKLVELAADIYEIEDERQTHTFPILSKLLGVDTTGLVSTNQGGSRVAESDALTTINLSGNLYKAILAHFEYKVELGMGGEGGIQCALTLRKQLCADQYEKVRSVSKCPCLLVTVAGPHIMFSGFIFSDIYVVQPFTDYIALVGTASGTYARIRHISKYFSIFREGLQALASTYKRLEITEPTNQIPVSTLLPCPSYKPGSNLPSQPLTLLRQYQADHYHLYKAKYGDTSALVKFCETYSEDAHRLLADKDLAPKLLYYAELRGGMKMIVMAYDPDTMNAHYAFQGQDLPPRVIEDVRGAISTLHGKDIVFGDLRRPNVLVKKREDDSGTWRAQLCDFDWAGKDGLGRYSPRLNTTGLIHWAKGVKPNGVMEKRHDWEMLETLTTPTVNTR